MKVYIIEEYYFCEGDKVITCKKAYLNKEKAEQFVLKHEDMFTTYEIVELNLE